MVTLPKGKSGLPRFAGKVSSKAGEAGIVHTLPLLVIIAAVGLISFLLITATLPITGLFKNLNPKPPSRAAEEGFLETFAYGKPTSPQPFKSARWIIGYGGNQNGDTNDGSGNVINPLIEAGHGPNCQGPLGNADPNLNIHLLQNTHTVDLYTYYKDHAPQQFFLCNDHMMTINKSGGDALFFMPRYLLDWSGGRTANLQFDTNPDGWARNWWEVYIAPQEELLFTANFSKRAVIFGNISHHFQIRRIANYNIANRQDPGTGYCSATSDPACSDPRLRRTHKISFNTTNWSMSVVKPDGTLFTQSGTWDQPLDFTAGMVLMTHYNYNPTKDGIPVNPSMITYHWANFMFDGPATRLMTGYSAPPQYLTTVTSSLNGRPAGKNPSDLVHINVTSSDLRNPRIWGVLEGREGCGNSGCPDPTHTDPKNTTRWGEVSLNGGPFLPLPTIRELGALNQPYPNDTGMGFETLIPASYPSPVRQGDNTLQFRANNYVGFQIHEVEIQVDPNEDLPPANNGGCAGPESGGNCTPGPSIPVPPGPPAPPPPPPPTPPPGTPTPGAVTVDFNIDPIGVINGQYPSGIMDWGTNDWVGSAPYSVFSTNSFSFNGNTTNSGTFSLLDPRKVVSIQAANGGTVASTVTIGCPGNPTVTSTVPLNQLTTITTNWTGNCTGPVTLTSTNGWNTNFDNMALSATGVTPPPPPAPTPSPTPVCSIGDIDCDGDVDIFDFNALVSNFGQTGANLLGDLDKDGDIDIFDFNSLIGNFGN